MGKITSKLQVTVPKAVAERYGLTPGDEIEWIPAGETIRIVKQAERPDDASDIERRLALFDAATERQRVRQADLGPASPPADRGWTREDLYVRERSD